MKNSKLRKQLEDLETENRRLTLAKEVALSPMEMTRTARSLGFVAAGESALPMAPAIIAGKPADVARADNKVKTESPAGVTHTVSQRPAGATVVRAEITAKARNEKTEQRSEGTRPRVVRPDITAVAKLR